MVNHICEPISPNQLPSCRSASALQGGGEAPLTSNRPYSGCNVVLLWMKHHDVLRYLTFKQAIELGGNVRKGEHGTKVYFVKQLQVADRNGDEGETRIVPMMREYTVF